MPNDMENVTKTIRLPADLIAAIIDMAIAEDRSFTYTITKLVRQSLALKALDTPKD